MAGLQDPIRTLRRLFDEEAETRKRRERAALEVNPAEYDENLERYDRQITEAYNAIEECLWKRVLRFGIHHDRHAAALKKFHDVAPFEKSVFIMTKYPDGNTPVDLELSDVIKAVQDTIRNLGLVPRLASDANYHPWIWDNVEVNALGSFLGVAIVESRYKKELNPNVAMEWGWMRGMGRPVVFLVEKGFDHLRADVEGLIRERFSWDDTATIAPAVKKAVEAAR
jgi:hypothetical protein